jgi:hypothetical protein
MFNFTLKFITLKVETMLKVETVTNFKICFRRAKKDPTMKALNGGFEPLGWYEIKLGRTYPSIG